MLRDEEKNSCLNFAYCVTVTAIDEVVTTFLVDAAEIRQRRARVAYSYDPQNEDELALKVGEELVIMGEDEEGMC